MNNLPKRRSRSLSKWVKIVIILILIWWTFQTWTLVQNTLTGPSQWTKPSPNTDSNDLDDFDDNEDISSSDSDNSDEKEEKQEDGEVTKRPKIFSIEEDPLLMPESDVNLYYSFQPNPFFLEAFERIGYVPATSWSTPKITWFVGATCAVKSLSIEDRLKINCDSLLDTRKVIKLKQLLKTLSSLTKVRGENCPKLQNFMSIPILNYEEARKYEEDDDNRMIIIRDAQSLSAKFIIASIKILKLVFERKPMSDFLIEEIVQKPALLENKKFSLRVFVYPLRIIKPMIGYFAMEHVYLAKEIYAPYSTEPFVQVSSERRENICLDEIAKLLLISKELLVLQIKRISLLILLSIQDSLKEINDKDDSIFYPPICLDFEFDQNSKVYLLDWKNDESCVFKAKMNTKSICDEKTFNSQDVIHLTEEYIQTIYVNKKPFVPKKKFKSLELLVDESTFSEAGEEICSISAYDQYIARQYIIRDRIYSTVFTDNGGPKSVFPSFWSSKGIKCSKCDYLTAHDASHCDRCGNKLTSRTETENDDLQHQMKDKVVETEELNTYQERLKDIFRKYDPSRLSNVDSLLERYKGDEESLIMRILRQYETLSKLSSH